MIINNLFESGTKESPVLHRLRTFSVGEVPAEPQQCHKASPHGGIWKGHGKIMGFYGDQLWDLT